MNKKISLFAAAVVTLSLIGAGCSSAAPQNAAPANQAAKPPSPNHFSVTYNTSGLSQKTLTVKAGDIIEFRNSDLKPHLPIGASDDPEFNAKTAIKPGDIWEFTPTKVGTWKFSDQINAKDARFQGELIVQ